MKFSRILLALFCVLLTSGCMHAQVSSANKVVVLTWTAPALDPVNNPNWAGCGTPSTCVYIASRAVALTGSTCPAAPAGGTAYTPLNAASPVSATTYTDAAQAGGKYCYIVQTQQIINGVTITSDPSNIAGPVNVPGKPGPPTSNAGSTQ